MEESEAGQFYDNLILSGTKIDNTRVFKYGPFYDNLILSGTKILGKFSLFH